VHHLLQRRGVHEKMPIEKIHPMIVLAKVIPSEDVLLLSSPAQQIKWIALPALAILNVFHQVDPVSLRHFKERLEAALPSV
jgi:hypothetical protein